MANTSTATCLPLFPSLEMAWRDVDSSFERFSLTAGIGAVEQILREDAEQLTGVSNRTSSPSAFRAACSASKRSIMAESSSSMTALIVLYPPYDMPPLSPDETLATGAPGSGSRARLKNFTSACVRRRTPGGVELFPAPAKYAATSARQIPIRFP
jgi:hypothetical protein